MHLRQVINALALDQAYHRAVSGISKVDLQGWGSRHPMLAQVVDEIRPTQIVEVGSWKGASAAYLAQCARKYNEDFVILCIDTFMGCNPTLWRNGLIKTVRDEYGFPSTYRTFLFNIRASGLTERVFPFPTTSTCGAEILAQFKVEVDVVYIDGGHREEEVALDILDYWRILRPGGVLLGDDYAPGWPGVVAAVDKFAAQCSLPVRTEDRRWRIDKPALSNASKHSGSEWRPVET